MHFLDRMCRGSPEALCEICGHDDARVRCDPEQRDHADPYGYREVDGADMEQMLHVRTKDLEV
jgi:hypothetical protein